LDTTSAQDAYRATVRRLSDRLVEAQRPIRILDSIKWDSSVQEAFFAAGARELPPVDRAYYEARPLPFDPGAKRAELQAIERDVSRELGPFNTIGVILRRMCQEYQQVVDMLDARGTPTFSRLSQLLYGAAHDAFHAGDPTLADLGGQMGEALENIDRSLVLAVEERSITSDEAVATLQERLNRVFCDPERPVRVMLSDGIVADAAAGSDYLKIRREARFNARDIRLLEIHEGWVHVGTTLNGLAQPYCTFLAKGPPSSTVTQEGLAILMELLGFASHPARVRRLTNRIRGVAMAEEGADFLDVFRFLREQGFPDTESFANTQRVFRGSTPDGGPFTKDISYSKGFVQIYNYVLLAVRKGLLDRIPLLFCGKTTLEDMRVLAQLVQEGLVAPPKYLPPPVADLNAVTAWMCYSSFLSQLHLDRIEADYAGIL
jgi:uncharacterized protein (TIGR02421 family)